MRPIENRFGTRAPRLEKGLDAHSTHWHQAIARYGRDAANWLSLTTQNTVRSVHLTSGPDHLLDLAEHWVDLLDVSRCLLLGTHRAAAEAIRTPSQRPAHTHWLDAPFVTPLCSKRGACGVDKQTPDAVRFFADRHPPRPML